MQNGSVRPAMPQKAILGPQAHPQASQALWALACSLLRRGLRAESLQCLMAIRESKALRSNLPKDTLLLMNLQLCELALEFGREAVRDFTAVIGQIIGELQQTLGPQLLVSQSSQSLEAAPDVTILLRFVRVFSTFLSESKESSLDIQKRELVVRLVVRALYLASSTKATTSATTYFMSQALYWFSRLNACRISSGEFVLLIDEAIERCKLLDKTLATLLQLIKASHLIHSPEVNPENAWSLIIVLEQELISEGSMEGNGRVQPLVMRCYLMILVIAYHIRLGQFAKAEAKLSDLQTLAQRSVRLLEQHTNPDVWWTWLGPTAISAHVQHLSALLCYGWDCQAALQFSEQALELVSSMQEGKLAAISSPAETSFSEELLFSSLELRFGIFLGTGDIERAQKVLNQLCNQNFNLKLYSASTASTARLSIVHIRIAEFLLHLHRETDAIQHIDQALREASMHQQTNTSHVAITIQLLAFTVLMSPVLPDLSTGAEMGESCVAPKVIARATRLLDDQRLVSMWAGETDVSLATYFNVALARYILRSKSARHGDPLIVLNKALLPASGDLHNDALTADILSLMGPLLIDRGVDLEGQNSLKQALQIAQRLRLSRLSLDLFVSIQKVYQRRQNSEKALKAERKWLKHAQALHEKVAAAQNSQEAQALQRWRL